MEIKTEQELKEQIDKLKNQIVNLTVWIIVLAIIAVMIIGIVSYSLNMAVKPIIYIYPEEEQKVIVSVNNPDKLTTTYPKYEKSWNVIAKPNGDLVDTNTGRNLYALYWEGKDIQHSDMSKGFVIKGEETAKFLEEKLEILGLNEREAQEFIIYWLPKMESNKYNFVYFQTMEEINKYMELEITPKPETLIRVMMEFKGLNRKIRIQEQELEKIERKGYTVVEWGGTELK